MFLPGLQNRQIPIVIEFGSFNTRIGYGGYDLPQTIVPSTMAYNDPSQSVQFLDHYQIYAPDNITKTINIFENHNRIEEHQYLQPIFQQIFNSTLRSTPSNHPILLVEPALTNRDYKIKLAEILFETFDVPFLQIHKAPLLTSYMFGKDNLLIIDSGGNNTYITPVQDGSINTKGLIKSNVGGEYLTQELKQVLIENKKVIRSYIKNDKKAVLEQFGALNQTREIKHQICKVYDTTIDDLQFNATVDNTIFDLPDQQKIEISKEIYTIPELIFQENEYLNYRGLLSLIEMSFEKIDIDYRRELSQNIILVGGNSLLYNLTERLQKELYINNIMGLSQKSKVFTVKAQGNLEKVHSSWIGGSIMASLNTFENFAMSKEDYEENGAIYIERKSLS